MRWRQRCMALSAVMASLVMAFGPSVFADGASSANYSVDRVFFGAGGELNACSTTYCAKQTAGEIAAGNTAATAFRAQAGFNVEREPYIAFSVAGTAIDLGYLSEASTATNDAATFAVKTYLASGYVVQIVSDPPTNVANPAYTIDGIPTPNPSAVGTEQFGMNLVENDPSCGAPGTFGAAPVQVPDNTFSFGTVASDYNTCGLFKYAKGDVIASSDKSSGETDYRISFIYNISKLTADGVYEFNGTLVATSTF